MLTRHGPTYFHRDLDRALLLRLYSAMVRGLGYNHYIHSNRRWATGYRIIKRPTDLQGAGYTISGYYYTGSQDHKDLKPERKIKTTSIDYT